MTRRFMWLPFVCTSLMTLSGCRTSAVWRGGSDLQMNIRLHGAIPAAKGEPRDVLVKVLRHDGVWTGAFARARRWNAATHAVDASDLTLGKDGSVQGDVVVTLLPDAWIPGDGKPRILRASVSAQATWAGIAGVYAGDFEGEETSGEVSGSVDIPDVIEGDMAGLLRVFLAVPGQKRKQVVLRFESSGGQVTSLKAQEIAVGSYALEISADGMTGCVSLRDGDRPAHDMDLSLCFLGKDIGGALRWVGSEQEPLLSPVSGSLEAMADSGLTNCPEEGDVHSSERLARIEAARRKARAVDVDAVFPAATFETDGRTLPYRLFTPPQAGVQKPCPVIVFLHGAGQRGDDNTRQLTEWPRYMATEDVQDREPCYVLVPQAASGWDGWGDAEASNKPTYGQAVLRLLDQLEGTLAIDRSREYVTGLSMGGFGTCYLLCEAPGRFAAGVPICGAIAELADVEVATPVWICHGNADVTVPVDLSRELFMAMCKKGRSPRYTEYDMVGHGVYSHVYSRPDIYAWMFAQQRRDVASR